MKSLNRLLLIIATTLLMAALCLAQGKKAMTFHGKVEGVNAADSSLKVNGEKTEGWMDAMTMDYKVDNPAVLKSVKPGDTIKATVYEGDMVLHKVEVVKK
ncbi:MAG TPA: copper-binding protein [Bryobacteraceae bacterium]|jgi:Cu/Ag efflux protein CusF|nr:copper-binding protein [Bryobacteraceae bacterium]